MSDGSGELFDAQARELANQHHSDSHYRWLTLSVEPSAAALRRVLSASWQLSGDSRPTLRKSLEHERWGQHIGALAQLLTLGFLRRLGLVVESEPHLAAQTPDMGIAAGDARALVEVRSLTGCGKHPWAGPGARAPDDEDLRPGQAVPRHLQKSRDRRRAIDRAEARAALSQDLTAAVGRALDAKAAAYRELCRDTALPYVICLYQDTDTQIARHVLNWAFSPAPGTRRRDRRSAAELIGGAFSQRAAELLHLSAVLVLGRVEADQPPWLPGEPDPGASTSVPVTLRGELILNPVAAQPLPVELHPDPLCLFACHGSDGSASWSHDSPPAVDL